MYLSTSTSLRSNRLITTPFAYNLENRRHLSGVRTPFSVIVYLPFFRDKLPFEIEAYIKKTGGKIFYVSNPKELLSLLRGFSESSA